MGLVLGLYVARYGTLLSRFTLLSCTTHSIISLVAILSQCQKAVDGHIAWVRAMALASQQALKAGDSRNIGVIET